MWTQRTGAVIEGHHFNVSAMRASFLVANHIAKTKKPFTAGEELILPAAMDICHELLGEIAFQKVSHVPLSASTITGWIDEITTNESPWFTIQIDESTDIDKTTMLVFVQYIFQEDAHENMLCTYVHFCWPHHSCGTIQVFE